MTAELPAPLVPPDVDLRDFAFMPLDVRRLLTSETWVLGTAAEKVAALNLWCEAWHQVPAASLPDNDRMLAHLSQAGATWKKVKAHALRGWVLCSDGRLYHPVIVEKALEGWGRKESQRARSKKANHARWAGRNPGDEPRGGAEGSSGSPPVQADPTGNATTVGKDSIKDAGTDLKDSLTHSNKDSLKDSTKDPKGQGQGQGQGQRNQGAPPAVGSTYGGSELPPLPDPPTEIAHWSNWLSRRGMSWNALRSERSRGQMSGWIEDGLTFEQMEKVWDEARRELKGGEPTSPTFLTVVLSRMERVGTKPTTEAEDRNAVFGAAT